MKVRMVLLAAVLVLSLARGVSHPVNIIADDPPPPNLERGARLPKSPHLRLPEELLHAQILPIRIPQPKALHQTEHQTDPDRVVSKYPVAPATPDSVTGSVPVLVHEYQGLLPSGVSIESVLPPVDDRVRISDTTTFPWRSIVKLYMAFPNTPQGQFFQCSGSLVDGFHVLTAGHCIYNHDEGGWATEVVVIPALDDDFMPFNLAFDTNLRSYTGWTQFRMTEHDWGLVTLDRNVGNFTGWMGRLGIADPSDPNYTGVLNLAGYPGDLDNGLGMYFDSDNGNFATDFNHWYFMDTAGGQSGSPVWIFRSQTNDRFILTIHTSGADTSGSNHGTRLDIGKANNLTTWLSSDTPPTDLPDLVDEGSISSGFSPTTLKPEVTDFDVTSIVSNIGTGGSTGFQISYYLSVDDVITTFDFLVGTSAVQPISPFSTQEVSFTGILPSSIPSGTYYFGWLIDADNSVDEFDEDNNTVVLPQQVVVTGTSSLVANLKVTKTSNLNPVPIGNQFTYEILVTNNGPDTATDVILTDNLPSELNLISVTPDQGLCNIAQSTIICNLGTLSDGDSTMVVIEVTAYAPGNIVNSVDALGNEPDPNLADNLAQEVTVIDAGMCDGLSPSIVGTMGDDVIQGTSGNDVIMGFGGADIISGFDGDDIICGGSGGDGIFGGNGDDLLIGQSDSDVLDGGKGNDKMIGGSGDDVLLGKQGRDEALCGSGNDFFNGGGQTDRPHSTCDILVNAP